MIRRLLGFVAAGALLLALFVYLNLEPQTADSVADGTAQDLGPDITARGVHFEQLDASGKLHYRLRAVEISQFQQEQLTRMQEPRIHLVNADQPPWDIESTRGYIRTRPGPTGAPEDIVFLREQVRMTQIHPSRGQLTLRGDSFYIYPDRQFAQTEQHVMIDSTVGRTNAAGLQADLASGLLTLASGPQQRVHTIVLPEQFKQPRG